VGKAFVPSRNHERLVDNGFSSTGASTLLKVELSRNVSNAAREHNEFRLG